MMASGVESSGKLAGAGGNNDLSKGVGRRWALQKVSKKSLSLP